ncbi:MAG: Cof-type HAD-IIB family hydrolase [Polyangiaceae bacterium]|nr:Cof-type HAD-IIB family hydrolase [Polyangiaceae bacterium]
MSRLRAVNNPKKPSSLYLSDLDGTLLDHKGELSERTRQGLLKLLQEGIAFSVASARSYFSITKLFGDIPFQLPIIEFNGAFLTDYQTGEHLEINSLGRALGEEIFDRVRLAQQRPFVCSFNGEEDCLHYDELQNPGMVWYENRRRSAGDPRLRQTRDLRSTMQEEVVSLTVMDQGEAKIRSLHDELKLAYGDELQLYCYENEYSRDTWWLTIHHRNASKHIAMKTLREKFAPDHELVAFGDNVNDLLMLEHADRAIAVENAVPELLGLADQVVEHHAKDSVIRFIENDFGSK